MSNFNLSTASGRSQVQATGNQLVVVVIKAQDLPNRRRLDKQSPYVVGRIQDQIQRTRVVPRGGQTPHFDQELWFSLDNVESRTLNLIIYHQQKKDSELVCSADIDFSTALRRSVEDGYDSWFDLQYKNKPAGRVFLEMTYYPSPESVPIAVDTLSRSAQFKTMTNRQSARESMHSSLGSSQGSRAKSSLMSSYNQELPDLPDLESIEDSDSIERELPFKGGVSAKKGLIPEDLVSEESKSNDANKGWFSRIIDNAYSINKNLPALFSGTQEAGKPERQKSSRAKHNSKFQHQLSSPALVEDIPHKLFIDSSDEEEEEDEDEKGVEPARRSPVSKSPFAKAASVEDYAMGQKVAFRSSVRGNGTSNKRQRSPTKYFDDSDEDDEEEISREEIRVSGLRKSFNSKPLPRIKAHHKHNAPAPPRHLIPTDSLFDSAKDEANLFNLTPRGTPFTRNYKTRNVSDSCKQESMSYSQIRKMKLLGLKGN
ncbi:DEKNAAC102507 [Brettanomyces naardenensis]|uniref:DEKNAAC102507 n=1 Tax=Brettanomyces naardenensis TaxID=13370 RepID=A0A448YKP9_BRENA|nr:DEKNAAC102507 [Brettanomyces naardenensis]